MKLAVIGLVVAAAVSSVSADPRPTPPPPTPTLAADPQYAKLCAPCHGADGQGYVADHAPSLVNSTFLASANDSFLRRGIEYGRPGTSMGAYGNKLGGPLDDAALDHMVQLLRSRGKLQPLPPAGQGDPARGAPVYTQLCKACHGDATMRGEAPHLANLQFQSNATSAFVKYAVVNGRPGTKMEPFAQKITAQQIDDVVAYVRQLADASKPAVELLPAPTGKEPLLLNPRGKDPSFTLTAEPGKPDDKRYVSIAQVQAALASKQKMIIVDARPPSEWRQVHIAGAVSMPYHDLKSLDRLPKDGTWIISYCACPHHLSGIVADELQKRGYKHAVVLDEGILEWQRRNLPIVAAKGHEKPPSERPVAPGTIQ